MLKDVHDAIKGEVNRNAHGPLQPASEELNTVSNFKRLKMTHFKTADIFDRSALDAVREHYEKRNEGWHEYAASKVSDDEGNPVSECISPCTFAQWAKGAKR